jgi:SPP1 family predicted phage head-tail adaptor
MARRIQAGKLDRRITIESRTLVQSATGAPTETWATFATVWAAKLDLRGREYFEARHDQAEITTEFTIRHLPGLKREMRIQHDGGTYDIIHIPEINRREGHTILARAQVA